MNAEVHRLKSSCAMYADVDWTAQDEAGVGNEVHLVNMIVGLSNYSRAEDSTTKLYLDVSSSNGFILLPGTVNRSISI